MFFSLLFVDVLSVCLTVSHGIHLTKTLPATTTILDFDVCAHKYRWVYVSIRERMKQATETLLVIVYSSGVCNVYICICMSIIWISHSLSENEFPFMIVFATFQQYSVLRLPNSNANAIERKRKIEREQEMKRHIFILTFKIILLFSNARKCLVDNCTLENWLKLLWYCQLNTKQWSTRQMKENIKKRIKIELDFVSLPIDIDISLIFCLLYWFRFVSFICWWKIFYHTSQSIIFYMNYDYYTDFMCDSLKRIYEPFSSRLW